MSGRYSSSPRRTTSSDSMPQRCLSPAKCQSKRRHMHTACLRGSQPCMPPWLLPLTSTARLPGNEWRGARMGTSSSQSTNRPWMGGVATATAGMATALMVGKGRAMEALVVAMGRVEVAMAMVAGVAHTALAYRYRSRPIVGRCRLDCNCLAVGRCHTVLDPHIRTRGFRTLVSQCTAWQDTGVHRGPES